MDNSLLTFQDLDQLKLLCYNTPYERSNRLTTGTNTMENHIGRPSVFTPETLRKLEEAFLLGCTDQEACFWADIGISSLYKYQKENPDFVERKNSLKQNPFFLARKSVVGNLHNPDISLKFLERKKKDEFSLRNEITGAEGQPLKIIFDDAFSNPTENSEASSEAEGDYSISSEI